MTQQKEKKASPVFIHQKNYTNRQRNKKRCRVNAWIPEDYREEFLAIAESMRDGSWED